MIHWPIYIITHGPPYMNYVQPVTITWELNLSIFVRIIVRTGMLLSALFCVYRANITMVMRMRAYGCLLNTDI